MTRIVIIALVTAVLGGYPLLVWLGLANLGAPALLGVLLAALAIRMFLAGRGKQRGLAIAGSVLLLVGGALAFLLDLGNIDTLRWYPVLASIVASGVFMYSLVNGRPVIERIARLREPALSPEGVEYTRRLTFGWAGLTFANGCVAAWTAAFASLETWALYNGLISYFVLGGFFCLEWIYRRHRFQRTAV